MPLTDGINYVVKTARLITKVALLLVVNIVAPTDQVHIKYGYLWGEGRNIGMIKKRACKKSSLCSSHQTKL